MIKTFVVATAVGLLLIACARTDKGTDTAGGNGASTSNDTRPLPRWDPMAPPDRGIEGGKDS
jgi:hypothetical protein